MSAEAEQPLHEVLERIRDAIIERFLVEVERRKLVPKGGLPRETIVNHLPDFIDELIGKLGRDERNDVIGSAEELETAREHAIVRWDAGYPLSTMVHEYGVLRDAILDVAKEEGNIATTRETRILTNWVIVGIAAAVDEYSRRRSEELRRQNHELQLERSRLQTMLELLPVGLVIADDAGRIVQTNEADNRIWGINAPGGNETSAEHAASPAWWPLTGQRVEAEQSALRRSLRNGEVVMNEELDIVASDGAQKTILVSSAPLRDDSGAITGAVAVNVDITDSKRALKRAEAAIVAREETVAIVSHDLRDPLGVIEGNALFVDRTLAAPNADMSLVRRRLDAIRRAGKRMERLITDLLDLSRIDEGKLPVEFHEDDGADLVRRAADEALTTAQQKSIQLRVEAQSCAVLADHDRILQVISNLLGNAIKATPEGGVVTIGVSAVAHECLFYVRDTGSGIHEKQLPFIFDRFWQAPGASRVGTGLGLAIAKGIVDAHGGKIWAESQPGRGATFRFTVPRARRAS